MQWPPHKGRGQCMLIVGTQPPSFQRAQISVCLRLTKKASHLPFWHHSTYTMDIDIDPQISGCFIEVFSGMHCLSSAVLVTLLCASCTARVHNGGRVLLITMRQILGFDGLPFCNCKQRNDLSTDSQEAQQNTNRLTGRPTVYWTLNGLGLFEKGMP